MFSKKVLTTRFIALAALALMLSPITVLAKDKNEEKGSEIFISSLQTPPPGHVLEKSFGSFVVVEDCSATFVVTPDDCLKTIDKAEKEFKKHVKKLGGNAILAQRINTQAIVDKVIFVFMQGEAVLLKPAP